MTDLSTMSDEELKALHGQTNPLAAMSDEDLKKAYGQNDPSIAYDVAASIPTGAGKGLATLLGLPADVAGKVGYYRDKYITNPLVSAIGGTPMSEDTLQHGPQEYAGSGPINNVIQKVAGEYHAPQTPYGKYAESGAQFGVGALAMPAAGLAGVASNVLRYGIIPGLATEAAGQATEGTKYEPYARMGTAIASTMVNPLRAVTPLPTSEMRQQFVNTLKNEGVTSLTAGQKTGNEALRYLESATGAIPGAGHQAGDIQNLGQQQFTEAAMKRAGAGPDASPEVLGLNQKRLSQTYDQITARNTLVPDSQFGNDLGGVLNSYDRLLEPQQRAIVGNVVDGLIQKIGQNNGVLPGADYQAIRSELRLATDGAHGAHKAALGGIRQSLDDLMQRSVAPSDAALWNQTNREYHAQKTLETAASRAGEAAAEGQITPVNLRNIVSTQNRGAYARGEGQFNDLARAGSAVMNPLPNSGTGQRGHAIDFLGSSLGGGLGAAFGGVPGAAGGAALGMVASRAVPPIASRALMSGPMQSYLSNQLIGAHVLPTNTAARNLLMIELLKKQSEQPAAQIQ